MRVGIDLFSIVPGVGRGGGFHRYATNLVRSLAGLDDGNEYVLFVNRRSAPLFPPGAGVSRRVVGLPFQRELWPFRLVWQHVALPLETSFRRLDVVHFPTDTSSLVLPRPYVVTIHDTIADVFYPSRFPGSVSPVKARYLFAAKRRAAQRASGVITSTRATAQAISEAYGISLDRITVIPWGVDPQRFSPAAADGTRSNAPYVLSVVSLSPHKNIENLIRGFDYARKQYSLPHELHIVGMRGTDASRVEAFLESGAAAALPVKYLGFIDDDALARKYASASLMLFVPLAEGFGFPPLEAMAASVPVVASDIGSVAEVCGDAAVLVPPDDAINIGHAVGRVLTDHGVASALVQAGHRRVERFSWLETARRTSNVYRTAVDQAL